MRTHHLCVWALLIAGGCAHHSQHAPRAANREATTVAENSRAVPPYGTPPTVVDNNRTDPAYGTPADNTDINDRDRASNTLTPMDQGGSEADRNLVQRIRKAVVADDTLSFNAKNVKVITRDGHVTLRGAVANTREKATIEKAARDAAGPTRVTNELEVTN